MVMTVQNTEFLVICKEEFDEPYNLIAEEII